MRRPFVLFTLIPLTVFACATPGAPPVGPAAGAPSSVTSATEPPPGLRLPTDVIPRRYQLDLDARPGNDSYTGRVAIDLELSRPRETLWLHAKGLQIQSCEVVVNGATQPASLLVPDDAGTVALVTQPAIPAGKAQVVIAFKTTFNRKNDGFFKVESEGHPYLVTQFESTSARLAFPCFDEPSFKAPLVLSITTDTGLFVAGNSAIATTHSTPDGSQQVTFRPTPPLPTYLYAWTVGAFEVVEAPPIPANAIRKTPLPLRGVAPQGHGSELAYGLENAARILAAEEAYFGIPFPFEKLDLEAVPDFTAGAMENPGLITFRNQALLVNEKATPLEARKTVVADIAHELAHQWFGDLVTLAWWDDVWLNESFASWFEVRASDLVHPELHFAMEQTSVADRVMRTDSLEAARQIRQPIVTAGDIDSAFDGITYGKGAAVIGMFERYLGADTFQKGIRAYLMAHAGANATAADLLAALGEASGKDVATPFRTFLDQPGVPRVDVDLDCSKAEPALTLGQTRFLPLGSHAPTNLEWQIPVCVRYDQDGSPGTTCTLFTGKSARLPLPAHRCPGWVNPNADAAGYYRWTLPEKLLAASTRSVGQMSDAERLSITSAIRAGYSAGIVPAASAFTALEPFALDPVPEIATAYSTLATPWVRELAGPDWERAAKAKLASVYRPLLARVGLSHRPTDDEPTVELRRLAVDALADLAEDPAVRDQLAVLGRAYLGIGGNQRIHPEAVASEIAGEAATQALRADPSLLDSLQARFFAETDETARRNVYTALTHQVDPGVAAKVRTTMPLDPRTRVNEAFRPWLAQLSDRRTRSAAWADFQAGFDPVLARLPEEYKAFMPMVLSSSCDPADVASVQAFFQPRLKELPGGARRLKQSVEQMGLCATLAKAQEASARAYFTR